MVAARRRRRRCRWNSGGGIVLLVAILSLFLHLLLAFALAWVHLGICYGG